MTDYIVSARKYRPQTFDSVIGQENITQTLAKAIEKNQLGSAFLFCGPRGVGKTTCARILAREVNQFHSENPENDPNFAFNIFELDAASNSGVDAMRDLIDQVRVPPQTGKYKVYIIDEVHMLSPSAFNAFLKTLEEPPSYAIFILATTEKQKVLPTIISRCQVFDFNRIQVKDIVGHLSKIAGAEGIEADGDALHIIAEKADGALRDALSIFDRMASSTAGDKITYESVIENLNILDHDYYFRVVEANLTGDRSEAMLIYDSIMQAGFDGQNFVSGMANHLRNLLMATSPKTADIIETGESIKQRYLEQSAKCSTNALVKGLETLGMVDSQYKASQNQRLLVEIALLKLCEIFGDAEKKTEVTTSRQPTPAKTSETSPAPSLEPKAESSKPMLTERSPETKPTAAERGPSSDEITKQPADNLPQSEEATGDKEPSSEIDPTANNREEQVPKSAGTPAENPLSEPTTAKRTKYDTGKAAGANPSNLLKEPASSDPNPSTTKTLIDEGKRDKPSEKPIENQNDPKQSKSRPSPLDKFKGVQVKGMPSLKELGKPHEITSATQYEAEGVNDLNEPQGPTEPFNIKELWEAWDEYAAKVKARDMQSYHATLTKNKPVMVEPFHIEFLVDNHVQLGDLESDRSNLLEFLRERLQNRKIQLTGHLAEDDGDEEDSLYDPMKKFAKMNQANPALQKLRSTFDLDIEHDI